MLNRILLVDDDPDVLAVTQMALEELGGWRVSAHQRGEDALTRAVAFAPDLMILDVMIGDIEGPILLKRLRQFPELAQVPVVYFTARRQGRELLPLMGKGVLGFLRKPFDPMTLCEEVRTLWRGAATSLAS